MQMTRRTPATPPKAVTSAVLCLPGQPALAPGSCGTFGSSSSRCKVRPLLSPSHLKRQWPQNIEATDINSRITLFKLAVELEATQSQLRHTTSQLSELSAELDTTRADLEATVGALEERTAELKQERAALETARGELGLTQSRIGLIERELTVTKRSLMSYQSQLERARCDLEASRASPSPGGMMWGS